MIPKFEDIIIEGFVEGKVKLDYGPSYGTDGDVYNFRVGSVLTYEDDRDFDSAYGIPDQYLAQVGLAPIRKPSPASKFTIRGREETFTAYVVEPHQKYSIVTSEKVKMPDDYYGMLFHKSSSDLQPKTPLVDPGFEGYLTFTGWNASNSMLIIPKGAGCIAMMLIEAASKSQYVPSEYAKAVRFDEGV